MAPRRSTRASLKSESIIEKENSPINEVPNKKINSKKSSNPKKKIIENGHDVPEDEKI